MSKQDLTDSPFGRPASLPRLIPTRNCQSFGCSVDRFNLYPHQVAGHGHIRQYENGTILKPAIPNECEFYEKLPERPHLSRFVPQFHGHKSFCDRPDCEALSVSPEKPIENHYIILEDLFSPLHRPCILDIKMGTRLFGEHSDLGKQARAIQKSEASTNGSLGFRICGMKITCPKGGIKHYNKQYGRRLNQDTVAQAFRIFFSDPHTGHVRFHLISQTNDAIAKLREAIQQSPGLRFICSSLILAYDTTPESDRLPLVRVIDFAKTYDAGDGRPDDGFLLGLESISRYLSDLSIFRQFSLPASLTPPDNWLEDTSVSDECCSESCEE